MKILLAILLLTITALPIDRPYLGYAFYSVKCDAERCKEQPKIFYSTYTIQEALKRFTKEHPENEIRCITRDYYYSGCVGWY